MENAKHIVKENLLKVRMKYSNVMFACGVSWQVWACLQDSG